MSALFLRWGIQRASRNTVGSDRTSACPEGQHRVRRARACVCVWVRLKKERGLLTPDPVKSQEPKHKE